MKIRDRDVRDALSTLIDEFENSEYMLSSKSREIEELQSKISSLETTNSELEDKIQELEEALAEAYLTSGPVKESKDVVCDSGHSRPKGSPGQAPEGDGG